MTLTVKGIAKLKPGRYHDGNGLYLKVVNETARSWLLRTTIAGKESWVGLGPLRDVPLDEARELARLKRREVAQGINPIAQRREMLAAQRAAVAEAHAKGRTFEEAARACYDFHSPKWDNDKHRVQFISTLEEYAFPILGRVPVADVKRPMVRQVLEQKLKKAEGKDFWSARPETARRVRSRIAMVLDFAKANEWRGEGENPAAWVGGLATVMLQADRQVVHHRPLPWKEMPEFMVKLRTREGSSPRALEFLILTAARTGEVIGATWDEIDLDEGVWTVPGNRMKAGKPHRVPLTKEARALLRNLPREKGNDFLFIGPRAAGLSDMSLATCLRRMEAARKSGDEDTLIALAAVQSFLSGLPAEMHQFARDTLIEAHAPQEAAALAGIAEQQKFAAQLRDTMLQSVADLVDFQKADEIIAAASADLA